jgi:hypothetical protein
LYFQYKKNENARTEQKLDIKTLLCIDRDNPSRISRRKTPSSRCRDNQNEKMMRKELPKNSTKDMFHVIHLHLTVTIETQEDSTIIKTYPETTKPSKQETKVDVCDCSRENGVCTQLAEGQHAYVREYQAKTHVYVSKHS